MIISSAFTRTLLLSSLAGVVAGCDSAPEADAAPGTVSVLAVQATPALEIGQMEGDPNYSFEDVIGTIHLPSGNLAVADGGSEQISIFGPDGMFIRKIGGRGEGPGEFRDLVRLYSSGSDSIRAADGSMRMVLAFDTSGAYGGQVSALDLSGDSVFALDSWLHRRFWIEGALSPDERAPVRAALDALPQPTTAPGFRMVRVAEDGRLWIREPDVSPSGTRTWTVVETSGQPAAVIDLPAQLDPLEIRRDDVTGRWLGESDVHFVRTYTLAPSTEARMPPAWLSAPSPAPAQPAPAEDEFMLSVRDAIKRMAVAQEIHYASHMTYTPEADSLDWERPVGVEVTFVEGNARAWSAAFTHPAMDRVCALAYGFNVPAGWLPGMVVCSPAREPAAGSTSR